jgi:hypothetical protein
VAASAEAALLSAREATNNGTVAGTANLTQVAAPLPTKHKDDSVPVEEFGPVAEEDRVRVEVDAAEPVREDEPRHVGPRKVQHCRVEDAARQCARAFHLPDGGRE